MAIAAPTQVRPPRPLALAAFLLPRLGAKFIPELDEGAVATQVTFPTGISLPESVRHPGTGWSS